MLKNLLIIIFALGIQCLTLAHAEPMNLDTLKQQLIQYHDSGQYNQEIAKVIAQAKLYLQKRIQENEKLKHPKKLAIVLDIDETSLSNYNDMKLEGFGGAYQTVLDQEAWGNDPAIKPTLELYQYAIQKNIPVFFITGRRERYLKQTISNLRNVGYIYWTGLYLKPNDYDQSTVVPFKSSMRKKIENMGYDIVLNIGDQYSDLKGGYADKAYKLPDPYYYVN